VLGVEVLHSICFPWNLEVRTVEVRETTMWIVKPTWDEIIVVSISIVRTRFALAHYFYKTKIFFLAVY
jgi:hypothetical protein